jgi:arginine decarboxylase-like protein
MKVNQNRAVIEEYLREGSRYNFGLEAGSKAELYAALALEQIKGQPARAERFQGSRLCANLPLPGPLPARMW